MTDEQIDCPRCGQTVPDARFCIRCGESLRDADRAGSGRRRGSYAAAPAESVARVALFSTILPHLPHADLAAFRLAFAGGLVVLLGLVAVGAFPVALVGAAVLVPALILLYVYSVDVYEETPITVLVLTLVWGAAWGVAFGLAIEAVSGGTAGLPHRVPLQMLTLGVIVPLLGVAAMMAGPLLLLRDRRYNDVLDGATFGVASAVAFVGAQVVAGSLDLFAGGLTPVGEPLPWVGRILSIAVALPIVAAGAIGSAVGAFSLRYRAPVRDRAALGIVGRPAVAVVLAGGLLVAAALAAYLPSLVAQVAVQLVLAAVALVWLRQTIHLGLLEEAFEVEVGPEIVCANCGRTTVRHTFCGECGIALRALPKRDRDARRAGRDDEDAAAHAPDRDPDRPPGDRAAMSWPTGPSSEHPFPSSGRPHWAPPGDEPARLRGRSVVVGFAAAPRRLPGRGRRSSPSSPTRPSRRRTASPGPSAADRREEERMPHRRPRPARTRASPAARRRAIGDDRHPGRDAVDQHAARVPVRVLGLVGARHVERGPARGRPRLPGNVGRRRAHRGRRPDIGGGSAGVREPLARPAQAVRPRPEGRRQREERHPRAGDRVRRRDRAPPTPDRGPARSRRPRRSGSAWSWPSDGRTTAAVIVIVWNPDKSVGSRWLQYNIRSRAELTLKTFRWGPS